MLDDDKYVTNAHYDPQTQTVVFGGAHFNHYSIDAMIPEGMQHLVQGFVSAVPEAELKIAQRMGAELAPGGSGLKLSIPERGLSGKEVTLLGEFITRVDRLLDKARAHQVTQEAKSVQPSAAR